MWRRLSCDTLAVCPESAAPEARSFDLKLWLTGKLGELCGLGGRLQAFFGFLSIGPELVRETMFIYELVSLATLGWVGSGVVCNAASERFAARVDPCFQP